MLRWTLWVAALASVLAVAARSAGPRLPRRWADGRTGIALRYAAGWHVSRVPWTPVGDPVQRFVLYSGSSLPATRLAPARRQVIAQLDEQVSPPLPLNLKGFPPRQRRFALPSLGRMEGFDGNRWAEIVFREHGRGFYLFIGVGAAARGQVAALLASLDSLVVRAR